MRSSSITLTFPSVEGAIAYDIYAWSPSIELSTEPHSRRARAWRAIGRILHSRRLYNRGVGKTVQPGTRHLIAVVDATGKPLPMVGVKP